MPAAPLEISHDPAARRFTVTVNGAQGILEYRQVDAQTLDYYRTFVPNALRGGGVASQLTDYALRYARDNGLKVAPTCPFIAAYIERHAEYRPLVA